MSSPFVPKGAKATFERTDQGVDFQTDPGGPIVAPWPGSITLANSNPGGFGTHYPLYTPSSGPYAGQTFYIGHTYALKTGQVNAGDIISKTGVNDSWQGNAQGIPGHAEIGLLLSGGGYPSMSGGAALKDFIMGQSTVAGGASTGGSSGGGFSATDPSTWIPALFGQVAQEGAKLLLYAVLIFGGMALIVRGSRRSLEGGLDG